MAEQSRVEVLVNRLQPRIEPESAHLQLRDGGDLLSGRRWKDRLRQHRRVEHQVAEHVVLHIRQSAQQFTQSNTDSRDNAGEFAGLHVLAHLDQLVHGQRVGEELVHAGRAAVLVLRILHGLQHRIELLMHFGTDTPHLNPLFEELIAEGFDARHRLMNVGVLSPFQLSVVVSLHDGVGGGVHHLVSQDLGVRVEYQDHVALRNQQSLRLLVLRIRQHVGAQAESLRHLTDLLGRADQHLHTAHPGTAQQRVDDGARRLIQDVPALADERSELAAHHAEHLRAIELLDTGIRQYLGSNLVSARRIGLPECDKLLPVHLVERGQTFIVVFAKVTPEHLTFVQIRRLAGRHLVEGQVQLLQDSVPGFHRERLLDQTAFEQLHFSDDHVPVVATFLGKTQRLREVFPCLHAVGVAEIAHLQEGAVGVQNVLRRVLEHGFRRSLVGHTTILFNMRQPTVDTVEHRQGLRVLVLAVDAQNHLTVTRTNVDRGDRLHSGIVRGADLRSSGELFIQGLAEGQFFPEQLGLLARCDVEVLRTGAHQRAEMLELVHDAVEFLLTQELLHGAPGVVGGFGLAPQCFLDGRSEMFSQEDGLHCNSLLELASRIHG